MEQLESAYETLAYTLGATSDCHVQPTDALPSTAFAHVARMIWPESL